MRQASFDSDDSCYWLANIIDQAAELNVLTIKNQIGYRRIYVDIVYATEDADGTITITDLDSGCLILEQPTTRT